MGLPNTHDTLMNGDDDDNDGGIESGIKGREGNQMGVNREGAEKIRKKKKIKANTREQILHLSPASRC